MAYPSLMTIADVESFYPNIRFKDTTKPTIMQVERWIDEATAFIYSAIADTYSVPVTDDDDLHTLRAVARMYVMEFVASALGQNRTAPDDKDRSRSMVPNLKMFYEHIEMLKKGMLDLPNSTKKSSDKFKSYNADNSVEAVARKTENLW